MSLSSYRNTIINQSARVFSLSYLLNVYISRRYDYQKWRLHFVMCTRGLKWRTWIHWGTYLPTVTSLRAENEAPRTPQAIPNTAIAILKATWYQASLFHFSFRWKTQGKTKHKVVPVKQPNKPMKRPKWGTAMARNTPNVKIRGRVRRSQNQWQLDPRARCGK